MIGFPPPQLVTLKFNIFKVFPNQKALNSSWFQTNFIWHQFDFIRMPFVIIQLSMRTQPCPDNLKIAKSPTPQTIFQIEEKTFKQDYGRHRLKDNSNCHSLCPALVCVPVAVENLLDLVQIYEWRAITDYPIVNCTWRRVIFNKSTALIADQISRKELAAQVARHHPSQTASLWVQTERTVPLENFELISASQFLYAFKEALIGFQRLFALFGSFQIKSGMVCVNSEGRVKVWVSNHCHINAKTDLDTSKILGGEQQQMIYQLKQVFLRFASDGSTFRDFFKGIHEIRSFINCLKYIEQFASNRKIKVSRKIMKKKTASPKRPLSPIINLKPIARTPKFITLMRQPQVDMKYIPSLQFGASLDNPKDGHSSQLKTKQTLNQQDYYDFNPESLKKAGKIVKNRGRRHLLSNVKSLENLYEDKQTLKAWLEESTIEQQMRRLLQDEASDERQVKAQCLTQLGRQVRESLTII